MTIQIRGAKGVRTALLAGISVLVSAGVAFAQDIVKIAQLDAQTGPMAAFTMVPIRGAKLAVDEINAAGGFKVGDKTYKFELYSPDTRGDPKEGAIQLKKAIEQEGAKIIFGPTTSNVFLTTFPYVQQHGANLLQMTSSSRALDYVGKEGSEFLVRTWNTPTGPNGQLTHLIKYVLDTYKPAKLAVLMPNHEGGKVTMEFLSKIVEGQPVELIKESYDPTTKDFSPLLSKMAGQGTDWLIVGPGSDEAAVSDLVRQASEGNYFHNFVNFNGGTLNPGMKNKDMIEHYVIDAGKYFPEAVKNEPKVKQFVETYEKAYKEEFPYSIAATCISICYDSVYMLVEAMQKAGTVDDMVAVKKALLGIKYEGMWTFTFSPDSRQSADFDIVDIKKGGEVSVQRIKLSN